ncbi:ComGF family competence protein [Halobacillus yeomjeoni]|uniref:ComGF family competence protein n=1 Tax=Halobacillus yeomjeoni TaxID=311194 RepID=UPI001CD2F24E|nr:ComGF family competence protein [Halobacillus yeomjeoni]MCA0982761.1 ComGF family competence protein [Halobacillus yeomjeoni]
MPSNSKGFTLSETLITLSMTLIILSLSHPLLVSLQLPRYEQELEVRQFFSFLQEEVNNSRDVYQTTNTLIIVDALNRTTSIEKYRGMVRRRVNGSGHEELLNEVEVLEIAEMDHFFIISVTMKGGVVYQKHLRKAFVFQ